MNGVIVLRHIKVQNANAITGMTWGFPAVASFLGFTHALSRKFNDKYDEQPITFLGCGIVCHHHQSLAHKTHEYSDYLFALSRNPLDKDGKSPALIEEGKMHLDVSLVVPFKGRIRGGGEPEQQLLEQLIYRLRLAGGIIESIASVKVHKLSGESSDDEKTIRKVMRSLMPGFALVSRRDTLIDHQKHRAETPGPLSEYGCSEPALEAWLDFSTRCYKAETENDVTQWRYQKRPYKGWLRPIAVGYKAISELYEAGTVANARDKQTPMRFVEALYSLGEWLSPHRIKSIEQLYWYQHFDEQNDQYLCINEYQPPQEIAADELALPQKG